MKSGRALHAAIVEVSQTLWQRGWVGNHDGNVTAREGNTIVATPTATSKRRIALPDLVECDLRGKVTSGRGRVFGEIGLHVAVYQRRPDIGAVVHAHPPNATAIACSRTNPIEVPFIAEAVVSLGALIPKVAFALPGEPAVAALAPWCEQVDAVLLTNHGVLAWGADLEQAYLRLELVEHLATIALAAVPIGGVEPLPESCITAMLAARAKAGLGLAASSATPAKVQTVVACAPAPHANVKVKPLGGSTDLAAIIRDEIARTLRD